MRMCPKCHKNFIHDGKTACPDCASKIVEPIASINVPVVGHGSTLLKPAVTNSNSKKTTTVKVDNKTNSYKSIFFCFQGNQYQYENKGKGGYIFALDDPKVPSWIRLKDVKPGDIIFHSSEQKILAISVVVKEVELNAVRPKEHYLANKRSDKYGIQVQTEYTELKDNLIVHSNYKKEIVKLQGDATGKGYPFNKNGTGNQGYLFNLNKDLAKFFMEKIIKANPHLATSIFAQELL